MRPADVFNHGNVAKLYYYAKIYYYVLYELLDSTLSHFNLDL